MQAVVCVAEVTDAEELIQRARWEIGARESARALRTRLDLRPQPSRVVVPGGGGGHGATGRHQHGSA
jgi:hypothetical protein